MDLERNTPDLPRPLISEIQESLPRLLSIAFA
jgi:hypothetical protein